MNILVIGATGQIGWALTNALAQTSHQISILVRDKNRRAWPGNLTVFEAGLFTPDTFNQVLHNIDGVIYAVGLPEQFSFDPALFQRVNYELFKTFLNSLEQTPLRRLIYISTYEVFQPVAGMIRETHPLADVRGFTPYFTAMTQAYQLVLDFAERTSCALTTIHPAAVYGGLNTGDGLTQYLENLINWRWWRLPVIVESRLPVVHADSLATAIINSLDKVGAYIVSDQMTSLKEMALTLRGYIRSYSPLTIPLWMARSSTAVLEFMARLTRVKPIMSQVQIEFITKGLEPKSDHAQAELRWTPLSLNQGIQNYLKDRVDLLRPNGP